MGAAGCASTTEDAADQKGALGARGEGTDSPRSTADAAATDSVVPHGTVNGKAFAPTSGAAFSLGGSTNLIFSDDANTCDMIAGPAFTKGGTYIQIFGLGSEPGTNESADTKIAIIKDDCAAGTPADASHATRVVETSKVTLTRVDNVVEGSVAATFEDGSKLEGRFSIPTCSTIGESEPTCK